MQAIKEYLLHIVVAFLFLVLLLVTALTSCTPISSTRNKCDICGDKSFAELADGNEYCYEHYKDAIDYYAGK